MIRSFSSKYKIIILTNKFDTREFTSGVRPVIDNYFYISVYKKNNENPDQIVGIFISLS